MNIHNFTATGGVGSRGSRGGKTGGSRRKQCGGWYEGIGSENSTRRVEGACMPVVLHKQQRGNLWHATFTLELEGTHFQSS